MYRTSKSFHALVLGWIVLVGGPLVQSASAQEASARKKLLPLGASEVAFEWQYSCTSGKACSFTCPGSGGASNVTKLTLQLGSIPLGGDQKAFGVFYKFSTVQIPRANGFSLTTGISTLSCQVNGWTSTIPGHGRSSMTTRPQQASPKRKARRLTYGNAPVTPAADRVYHTLRSFIRTGSRRLSAGEANYRPILDAVSACEPAEANHDASSSSHCPADRDRRRFRCRQVAFANGERTERNSETIAYNLSTPRIGLPKRYVRCT